MRKTFVLALMVGLVSCSMLLAGEKENRKGRGRGEGEVRSVLDRGGSRVRGNKVEGLVTAVNLATGQVAIQMRNGVTVVVVANLATKVERNEAHVALAALKVGDRGEAIFTNDFVALKIETTGA